MAPEIVDEILKEGIDNLSLGGKTCDIAVLLDMNIRSVVTTVSRIKKKLLDIN